jgi:FMN phosphatase YigB (HAD superfamily)
VDALAFAELPVRSDRHSLNPTVTPHSAGGGNISWRPDAEQVIRELHACGHILGIVGSTMSGSETPQEPKALELTSLFRPVALSTPFGRRKPQLGIFKHATNLAPALPNRSAYIGDRPLRDVVGSQWAEFAMCIVVKGSNRLLHSKSRCQA